MLVVGGALGTSLAPAPDVAGERADEASAPVGVRDLSDEGLQWVLRGEPGRALPATLPTELPDAVSVFSAEDGLSESLVTQVRGLDQVVATTTVRTAMVGLFGSVDADGSQEDVIPRGMRIPVSATAVEPDSYLDVFVGEITPEDRALVRMLAPGEVLLSRSSAGLRGLDVGATVDLGAARGLRVAGVVHDDVTRGNEFLLRADDADAVDLGFGGRTALLVRHAASLTVRDVLDDVAEDAEESGEEVRVWHAGRRVPLVLSTVEVKERFGEFAFRLVLDQREIVVDRAFVETYIVDERMPVIGTVRCHRLIMDDLRAAVDELIAAGYEEWLSPRRYAGCYYPRRIGFGRENLSRHSWGIAIDLNVDFSLPGAGPVPPDELIAIMGRHGFRWGGDFTTPDNHHFEWVGDIATLRPDRT